MKKTSDPLAACVEESRAPVLLPLEIRLTQPGERPQSPTPFASHWYTSGRELVSCSTSSSSESKKRRRPLAARTRGLYARVVPLTRAPGIVEEPCGRSPLGLQEAQTRVAATPGRERPVEIELRIGLACLGVGVVVAGQFCVGEEREMQAVGADPGGAGGGRVVAWGGGIGPWATVVVVPLCQSLRPPPSWK